VVVIALGGASFVGGRGGVAYGGMFDMRGVLGMSRVFVRMFIVKMFVMGVFFMSVYVTRMFGRPGDNRLDRCPG
jgi:hypothetical protein